MLFDVPGRSPDRNGCYKIKTVSHTPEHAIRHWLAHPNLKTPEGAPLPSESWPIPSAS
jgi:hypothetical protein